MIEVEPTTSNSVEQRREAPGVFLYSKGQFRSIDSLIGLPPRVGNRMLLHQLEFCSMFTAVVSPNEQFDSDDLAIIRKKAELTNAEIGLPTPVQGLVVRTRDVKQFGTQFRKRHFTDGSTSHYDQSPRMTGTNPMLLVSVDLNNVYKFVNYSYSKTKKKNVMEKLDEEDRPVEWWINNRVMESSYLLVHEENPELQKKCIHGRIGRLHDGTYELSMGNNVLHARMIEKHDTPYLSMVGSDMSNMLERVAEGYSLRSPGNNSDLLAGWQNSPGLRIFRSNAWSEAISMARKVSPYAEIMRRALDEVKESIGKEVVLEWRLYPGGMNGNEMQIYDFDAGF